MRRHGVLELLLVLPDGSKSLIPAAWTDAASVRWTVTPAVATLGSLADLLHRALPSWSPRAAGRTGCREVTVQGGLPMQPVQLSLMPDPAPGPSAERAGTAAPTVERCPPRWSASAIALLAKVIAKAAAPRGSEVAGDE